MGPTTPLDALYTSAPLYEYDEDLDARPDLAELIDEPGQGTLGPELEPQTFDAAILAGLVTP